MAHNRKHYTNPTPPRRCDALVYDDEDETIPPVKCTKKVFKAGMCVLHYTKWVNAKTARYDNETRRRAIVMDGRTYYTTRVLGKTETPVSDMMVEQCVGKHNRCAKRPVINMDNRLWCMGHFQTDQKRRKRVEERGIGRAS